MCIDGDYATELLVFAEIVIKKLGGEGDTFLSQDECNQSVDVRAAGDFFRC